MDKDGVKEGLTEGDGLSLGVKDVGDTDGSQVGFLVGAQEGSEVGFLENIKEGTFVG